jgi:hypothetical protein
VSEVVGYILTFTIVATIVLVALLTFNNARAQAETRVREVEAASVAHRVAEAVVQAGLFQGRHTTTFAATSSIALDLPTSLQGRGGYLIELCNDSATSAYDCGTKACTANGADPTIVRVTSGSTVATEPLLGVKTARSCASGGRLFITFGGTSSSSDLPRLVPA